MASKLKVVAILLAIAVGVLVLLAPRILHGIDHGETRVDVGRFVDGFKPDSRNVVVTGTLVTEYSVEYTVRDSDRGSLKSRRRCFPLVAPGWTPKEPVHVVFSAKAWPGYRQEELMKQPAQKGVLRNILWEGISGAVKEEFQKIGVRLADDAVLVEEPAPAE